MILIYFVSLWGEEHDFNMEEVLKEIAYFKGITYYTSEFCNLENPLPECFKSNLTYYANLVSKLLQIKFDMTACDGCRFALDRILEIFR